MASDYDATEFIDGDFEARPSARSVGPMSGAASRAPSREEVDSKVAEAQQKLVELKKAQEELERERASLEETRRRQMEFQTGRQEMIQHLTRGIGLLEEAEFNSRRDAEQTAKMLVELRELTRALTALENARMEWNTARLKFTVLDGTPEAPPAETVIEGAPITSMLGTRSFGELCRLGFALTWPVAFAILAGIAVVTIILLRR
jgi:hypothetical protein